MSIGFGIFLFALGAILAFAVNVSLDWIALSTVGYILMVSGVVMVIIGGVLMARKRSSVTMQRTQVDPASGEQPASTADDPYAIDTLETLFRVTRALPWIGEALFDLALRLQPSGVRAGDSYAVLSHPRIVRFREMEYTVPAEAGPACLREVLETIRRLDVDVHWPLEYRYVRRDDAWLSMFHDRDGASISIQPSREYEQARSGCSIKSRA